MITDYDYPISGGQGGGGYRDKRGGIGGRGGVIGARGAEAGVEGAGSGDRRGGESGKIGREIDIFFIENSKKMAHNDAILGLYMYTI